MNHDTDSAQLDNFATEWIPLAGAGSARRYFRSSVPHPDLGHIIKVESEDSRENETFISLARMFREEGIDVPRIFEVSEDRNTYFIEELGKTDLFSLVGTVDFEPLASEALKGLARLQTLPSEKWEGLVNHPQFSVRQIMFDLDYFKYSFLKPSDVVFDEEKLQDDLERLAADIFSCSGEMSGFMYRDFQSRNVMVNGGRPWFIDFQGGRRGPALYDAVSFLWQAKAALPDDMKRRLLDVYAEEYERLTGLSRGKLLESLDLFVLFRTLQVLGAYGMRGLTQRRAHFLQSIPAGLANLRGLLDLELMARYPELREACRELCSLKRFASQEFDDGRLHIRVMSFSYKKGYPENLTANGGGFMFDCRAMHNPGRYAEYKALTGRDKPVVDFLEERGEVFVFLDAARQLVDRAAERYISRGFTSLDIGFGCTGGQHRSVYCAEKMARHLHERFPEAVVHLIHREQSVDEIL